jgi:PHD/YefM family antitoxin component YafN of YafNO toxin-antitoxin module
MKRCCWLSLSQLYKFLDKAYDKEWAVMLGEEELNSIEETLSLLSIPGMKESLLEGRQELLEECSEKLEW